MNFSKKKILYLLLPIFLTGFSANAQNINTADIKSSPRVEIFLSPRSGSFVEGSIFEVPVLVNTNSASIDEIKIKINFDKDKLAIVQPSSGKSIIDSWTESPMYNNTEGVINYVGTIPDGIVTSSGLIGTITFKALSSGQAVVSINSSSSILLKDELKTNAMLGLGRAEYNIIKKLHEGVGVFSETNPSEGKWYNNNNPIISWQQDDNVFGFSYVLDNKPFTIPDNTIDTEETTKPYENFSDDLWYFHIKAIKNNSWGNTSHFLFKIDTIPPAEFTPVVNNFSASAILAGRAFVSFFTTDNLSGVDYYEVGVINTNQPITDAPVFIETGSPFQVPVLRNTTQKIIVRAIDKAGNVREGYVEVNPPSTTWQLFNDNLIIILALTIIFVFIVVYSLIRRHRNNYSKQKDTFGSLDDDIRNYLNKKKEMNEKNLNNKTKIEVLEKELNEIKVETNNESQNI